MSQTSYTRLPGEQQGGAIYVQPPPPGSTVVVIDEAAYAAQVKRNRRTSKLMSAVCCVFMLLFLLLFFLLPRSPFIAMTSGQVSHFTPLTLNSTFLLRNKNFYATEFKDLRFGLYSLQLGNVGNGQFSGPVTVPARKSVSVQAGITLPYGMGLQIFTKCQQSPTNPKALVFFLGNTTIRAEAKAVGKDFGLIPVTTPAGVLFICNNNP